MPAAYRTLLHAFSPYAVGSPPRTKALGCVTRAPPPPTHTHLECSECLAACACALESCVQEAVEGAGSLVSCLNGVVLTIRLLLTLRGRGQHSSSRKYRQGNRGVSMLAHKVRSN
jgi:hypothetical protein